MAPVLRVSLAQFNVKKGNPRVNWSRVQQLVGEAQRQGGHLVVLPELWDIGYALDKGKELASSLGSGLFSQVMSLAQQHNLYILGSMLEKRGLGISNTAALISPKRGVLGAYRKLHLFPLMDEHKWLTPGEAALTFDLPWGRTAVAICYDLRFPELFRRYAAEGTRLVIVPAQWPHPRLEHFRTLVRARAIENQMYVVAVNRVGGDDFDEDAHQFATEFCGHSMVVDPWGNTVIELGEGEGVHTVDLDMEAVDQIRQEIPVLNDRRPEHYGY
ncbi:MAG: carbon-nitrogen family hydrolase [Chloroflexi bacterium]|nr:carbon-nitrogen family hydrolase [Chloroflexota bacterium]